MSNDRILSGKASNIEMENLHGRVASLYGMAIEGIQESHDLEIQLEEQLAEDENRDVNPKPFKLSKDELTLLSNATKFLKDNNVEMDVIKKSGSKKFSSKVQEITAKKRREAMEYGGQ